MQFRYLLIYAAAAGLAIACQNRDDTDAEIKPSGKGNLIETKSTFDGKDVKISELAKGTYRLSTLKGRFAPPDLSSVSLNQTFSADDVTKTTCQSTVETKTPNNEPANSQESTKNVVISPSFANDGTAITLMDLRTDYITLKKVKSECRVDTMTDDSVKFFRILQEGQQNEQGAFVLNTNDLKGSISFKQSEKQIDIIVSTDGETKMDIEFIYDKVGDEPKVQDHSNNVVLEIAKLGTASAAASQTQINLSTLVTAVTTTDEDLNIKKMGALLAEAKAPVELIQALTPEEKAQLGDLPNVNGSEEEKAKRLTMINDLYNGLSSNLTQNRLAVLLFRLGEAATVHQYGGENVAAANVGHLVEFMASPLCKEQCDANMSLQIAGVLQKALEDKIIDQAALVPYIIAEKSISLNASMLNNIKRVFVGFGTKVISEYARVYQETPQYRGLVVSTLAYHLFSVATANQSDLATEIPQTMELTKNLFKSFMLTATAAESQDANVQMLNVIESLKTSAKDMKDALIKFAATLKSIPAGNQNVTALITATNSALQSVTGGTTNAAGSTSSKSLNGGTSSPVRVDTQQNLEQTILGE